MTVWDLIGGTGAAPTLAEVWASAAPFTLPPAPPWAIQLPTEAALEARAATETARVAILPRVDPFQAPDLTDQLRTPTGTMRLRPIQSAALYAIQQTKGLLGPIGVGAGKTLIALLTGTVLDAQLLIIFTAAGLVPDMHRAWETLRHHWRFVPTRIVSYNNLSLASSSGFLDQIASGGRFSPDRIVVVCDEAHRVKRQESARTKRVLRFFQAHPEARFVALSGTITAKSVRDYAHLSELALRHLSPVPRSKAHVDAWAEVFDADGQPGPADWSMVSPITQGFGEGEDPGSGSGADRKAWARRALQARLRSCPGVVCTSESALGNSLVIRTLREPAPPPEIQDAITRLDVSGLAPDGEVAPDDMAAARVGKQLSCGFYYRWEWPGGVVDREWLEARKDWCRWVRGELKHRSREGYDSEFLVASAVARRLAAGERSAATETWDAWRRVKDRPKPPTVPVWISAWYLEHVAQLVGTFGRSRRSHRPTILWYESQAMERALGLLGFETFGAGTLIDEAHPRTLAASWRAHGTGRNLQAWDHQIMLELPSSGEAWEQLLGRLHRPGQESDEVEALVYQHTEPLRKALRTARSDATYIQDTTGNVQKLLLATWAEGVDLASGEVEA